MVERLPFPDDTPAETQLQVAHDHAAGQMIRHSAALEGSVRVLLTGVISEDTERAAHLVVGLGAAACIDHLSAIAGSQATPVTGPSPARQAFLTVLRDAKVLLGRRNIVAHGALSEAGERLALKRRSGRLEVSRSAITVQELGDLAQALHDANGQLWGLVPALHAEGLFLTNFAPG